MKVCRIRDNSGVEEAELSEIPQLRVRLADKTLGQLADEGVFFVSAAACAVRGYYERATLTLQTVGRLCDRKCDGISGLRRGKADNNFTLFCRERLFFAVFIAARAGDSQCSESRSRCGKK